MISKRIGNHYSEFLIMILFYWFLNLYISWCQFLKIFKQNRKNELKYDEDYIKNNKKLEPKFDIEVKMPKTLYHLSIQEYDKKIRKTKNKLSVKFFASKTWHFYFKQIKFSKL